MEQPAESLRPRDRIRQWIHSERGRRWIIALGIAGIGLIFLSSVFPKTDKTAAARTSSSSDTVTAAEYTAQLEQRLADTIGQVAHAGNCKVMITLENGVRYQYAQEEKTERNRTANGDANRTEEKDNTQRSYVIVDSGANGKQPLIVTVIQPEIKGVVVVCGGASDAETEQRIINVVTTALGVSSTRVCVVPSA